MKARIAAPSVLCIALVGAALVAPAGYAGEWDRKTTFTFTRPVELPPVHQTGKGILPPGTYVFKLVDMSGNRHVVQILNKEETEVFATVLAIPNERLKIKDKTVLTFKERPAGQPDALEAWFYPAYNIGEQFVYPKAKALELAKETHAPVMATEAPIPEEVAKPEEPKVVAQLEEIPVAAVEPPVEVAAAPAPEPEPVAVATAPPAEELPKTASPYPLIGLIGLAAFGLSFSLRAAASRVR